MPRPSTGSVLKDRDGKLRVQLTLPKHLVREGISARQSFPLSPALFGDEKAAEQRKLEMNDWLRQVGHGADIAQVIGVLQRMALAPTAEILRATKDGGRNMLSPSLDPDVKREKTFKEVALMWTSGELTTITERGEHEHGSVIKRPRDWKNVVPRFETYIFPFVGELPISAVNAAALAPVRVEISKDPITLTRKSGRRWTRGGRWVLDPNTRRNILSLCTRVLTMSAQMGYIAHNPLPPGWLPEAPAQKDFQCPYPDDWTKLMGCKAIPLNRRILWGFMSRYGLRGPSEVKPLKISNFDLKRGVVRAYSPKVQKWLEFVLDEGDRKALVLYLDLTRPGWKANTEAHMFIEDDHPLGLRPNFRFAQLLRRDLATAECDPALLQSKDGVLWCRGHDLRAMKVTMDFVAGKADSEIRACTSHTSSKMMGRYERKAGNLKKLAEKKKFKGLPTLDRAIPELCADVSPRSTGMRKRRARSTSAAQRQAAHKPGRAR
ncbi:MAG: hypothetical protein ACOYBP_09045 [Microbacteriaceae bacterium]